MRDSVQGLGPWASIIPRNATLAKTLLRMDQDRYEALAATTCQRSFALARM
jgi:hypothetical protein